jgi:hypothetical protein
MVAMECDLTMDAPTMKVVVTGTGPLGRFTATVSAVKMTGRVQLGINGVGFERHSRPCVTAQAGHRMWIVV